jgi:hypothetical protein
MQNVLYVFYFTARSSTTNTLFGADSSQADCSSLSGLQQQAKHMLFTANTAAATACAGVSSRLTSPSSILLFIKEAGGRGRGENNKLYWLAKCHGERRKQTKKKIIFRMGSVFLKILAKLRKTAWTSYSILVRSANLSVQVSSSNKQYSQQFWQPKVHHPTLSMCFTDAWIAAVECCTNKLPMTHEKRSKCGTVCSRSTSARAWSE